MKIILTIAVISFASSVHARTWTSSNGVTTFEAEYVSSTERSLVFIHKGKKETIRISRLSEADKKWIEQEQQRDTAPRKKIIYRSLKDQKVGKKLINQTFRLKNNQFVTENIRQVPQYYYLYFSASW